MPTSSPKKRRSRSKSPSLTSSDRMTLLNSSTVVKLKQYAKDLGLSGYSRMKKKQLVEFIMAHSKGKSRSRSRSGSRTRTSSRVRSGSRTRTSSRVRSGSRSRSSSISRSGSRTRTSSRSRSGSRSRSRSLSSSSSRDRVANLNKATIAQLKQYIKYMRLSGYSRLKKKQLVEFIVKNTDKKGVPLNAKAKSGTYTVAALSAKTIPELKIIIKKLKLKGYSRMNKKQLVNLIMK